MHARSQYVFDNIMKSIFLSTNLLSQLPQREICSGEQYYHMSICTFLSSTIVRHGPVPPGQDR